MNYIAKILGIDVKAESWEGTAGLPYYLSDRYRFTKVALDDVICLFMKPEGEPDNLSSIKKHIANVRKSVSLPIVLELNAMTARRRKSLIDARIPFIAPQCHIYLPFLGVALQERYTNVKPPSTTLMPSAQLLLFYYIYQNKPELYTGELAEVFNLSHMQISRAIKQLAALDLISARKDGVRTVISTKEHGRILFEKSKPYLINPVRKKIYVEHSDIPEGLPLSGCSALSELTMLGGSSIKTFAFYGKTSSLSGSETLVDDSIQAEIEIWNYSPALLSQHPGIADVLSLAVSLSGDSDPRVEQSVDELISNLWR